MRPGRRKKAQSPDPEALEAARQARAEAFRARTEGVRVRARGTALETRRRLRPVARPFAALIRGTLGRIAPVVSNALLFLFRLGAALVALVLEVGQAVVSPLVALAKRAGTATGRFLKVHVQPRSTFAFIAAAAAVAIGVSQFIDYQAVVAGDPDYAGEVRTVAPPPVTHNELAGDAHLYLLLPVAAAALVLVLLTYRGNWRLGRWIMALGLFAIAVSLVVDLPQGLDAGDAGPAFSGSNAELIEGFWAQLCGAAVLAISGYALGAEARRAAAGEGAPQPTEPRRRAFWKRKPGAAEGGGIAAGGGAGS